MNNKSSIETPIGKEEEIAHLLSDGTTPSELVKQGFVRGTVYKVAKRLESQDTTQQPSSVEQRLSGLEARLENIEANVGQLNVDSQTIPQHSHPHSHPKPGELDDLMKRVCGYSSHVHYSSHSLVEQVEALEKFKSEYEGILEDLKLEIERERAKQRCTVSNHCKGHTGLET